MYIFKNQAIFNTNSFPKKIKTIRKKNTKKKYIYIYIKKLRISNFQ